MAKRETIPLMLRLPPALHGQLVQEAKQSGLSLNELIIRKLGGDTEPDQLLELRQRIETLEKAVFRE